VERPAAALGVHDHHDEDPSRLDLDDVGHIKPQVGRRDIHGADRLDVLVPACGEDASIGCRDVAREVGSERRGEGVQVTVLERGDELSNHRRRSSGGGAEPASDITHLLDAR
jgi:hypothetical protein